MPTPFSEIYDLSLVTIRDYKIDQLYALGDLADFENFMQGFLKKAIPKFTNCAKALETIANFTTNQFDETLTLTEKTILSDLLIIEWMNSKILDVTQMQNHLSDTDFKTFSQAQNLKAKIDAREVLREVVSQDMTNYGLKQIPWTEWGQGVFK
jgi:hypothetical protein